MAYAPSLCLFYMHPLVRKPKRVWSFEKRFLVVHLIVILRYWFQLGAVCRYGPEGVKGTIPGNAWLTFDVELVAVKWELLSLWHLCSVYSVFGDTSNFWYLGFTGTCDTQSMATWEIILLTSALWSGLLRVVFCRFGMCSPWCSHFKIWCGSIPILIWCLILRCPLH